jgi:hypothetical protein
VFKGNGKLKGAVHALNIDKLTRHVQRKTNALTVPSLSDHSVDTALIHSQYLIADQPQIHHAALQVASQILRD